MATLANHSLPEEFSQRLKEIIPPAELSSVMQYLGDNSTTCFRINTLKLTISEGLAELATIGLQWRSSFYPNAFIIDHSQHELLTHSASFKQGHVYIQNLSSMLPAIILDPKPGEEILDLTAAPGSKTTLLACLMHNQGRIAAVEKIKDRFYKLKANLQLQGASCVHTYLKDGSLLWQACPDRFDRVLLDAPCSSESRFNSLDPSSYRQWSLRKIKEMARKQWNLLYSAFICLKPGGTLVYSTCTFAPEENEAIINKLLSKFADSIEILPIDYQHSPTQAGITQWHGEEFSPTVKDCLRILPNGIMDAFFICKIIKKSK